MKKSFLFFMLSFYFSCYSSNLEAPSPHKIIAQFERSHTMHLFPHLRAQLCEQLQNYFTNNKRELYRLDFEELFYSHSSFHHFLITQLLHNKHLHSPLHEYQTFVNTESHAPLSELEKKALFIERNSFTPTITHILPISAFCSFIISAVLFFNSRNTYSLKSKNAQKSEHNTEDKAKI